MEIGRAQLERALAALGELLTARGLRYELVLVGGGNLILRAFIRRPATRTSTSWAHEPLTESPGSAR